MVGKLYKRALILRFRPTERLLSCQ